jgi:hypothetical protein
MTNLFCPAMLFKCKQRSRSSLLLSLSTGFYEKPFRVNQANEEALSTWFILSKIKVV